MNRADGRRRIGLGITAAAVSNTRPEPNHTENRIRGASRTIAMVNCSTMLQAFGSVGCVHQPTSPASLVDQEGERSRFIVEIEGSGGVTSWRDRPAWR